MRRRRDGRPVPPGGPPLLPHLLPLREDPAPLYLPGFAGAAGQTGGGGAGGAFDVVADVVGGTADAAGKAAAGAGEAAGEVASGILDADECVLPLILLGALLAAVFGAGLYLIWQAPSILPEAAFDAALAASLLRGAKRIDAPDWTGGVFRATWKPFLWIAAATLAFALAAAHYFPHARKLADLFTSVH